ncbi:stage V sporulation protein AE [Anoxybacillus flavithermus]|uniref:Stage V sporulation protein AE n=1 Tax=Anoxybacillus flavithermus AK1 TaxID=1297581 RepID=M8D931_9BACL|nr:stage V sporulation protein AE [Anoxybacillus flavithermus]EMT47301.1 stage V sporulation protein AE [Anoxybacillus flavithermus AK1]
MKKRKVILVTDGDQHVQRALEWLAKQLGGRCISQSQGNPSRLTGKQLVDLILQTPYDPVFVMFDDSGIIGEGAGEQALRYVATHKQIDVLGAIAVASDTNNQEWTKVHVCIDYDGCFTTYGVDKEGICEWEVGRINGDTVYCLDELSIPIVVGIGDIGKMRRRDDIRNGCPITRKAIEYILERSRRDENRKLHTDFSEVE